jgi:alkylresorcinol/alkylpyrone synthase
VVSHVISVAPVLPGPALPQEEITATIAPLLARDPATRAVLEKVHRNSGVSTRHLALPLDQYAGLDDFGRANDLFCSLGGDLAEVATREALAGAGLSAADVDFVLFTSVTGISAPSLDVVLVERLGFRPDVKRMPSFGLGCVGGAAGLARVHDYLAGHPHDVALLVCLELCSLTIQHDDASRANLISSGLFGDGSAAAVVVGRDHPAASPGARAGRPAGPEVVATRSTLYPGTDASLGWDISSSGFRIVLAAGLPDVIEQHLAADVEGLLVAHGLKVGDVTTWVVHAGGPRVLEAVTTSLGLAAEALDVSRSSLAAVGNLSSASVLDVLDRTTRTAPPPGSPGVIIAFGPGVSVEVVLLRWPEAG